MVCPTRKPDSSEKVEAQCHWSGLQKAFPGARMINTETSLWTGQLKYAMKLHQDIGMQDKTWKQRWLLRARLGTGQHM